MIKESYCKKKLTILFCIAMFLFSIKSGSYAGFENIINYLKQNTENGLTITMDSIEAQYVGSLWKERSFINLNGTMARLLNMQGYYSSMDMYITDDRYIVSASAQTTTDYEYEETMALKSFLDERGIHLLYVNEPTKYIDDSLFIHEFGIETYSNRNADLFLQRISDGGVNVIDLREKLLEDELNVFDMFYRTDHHWTTLSGLWAAREIAEGLNEYCGYSIDTSIYAEGNYTFTSWEDCWLGEQGRKVGETYVGLDDYTEVKPNFSTNYTFKTSEGFVDGTFDNFINENIYNTENNVYENSSWHYSYSQINCINNNVDYGKVLILGDSFEQVTEPFISLGVSEVDTLVLRGYDDSFSLRQYIEENDYDTVIICYAQFMIGAHDDISSANYRMYSFE